MKKLALALGVLMSGHVAFAASGSVGVDSSRDGIVEITISGGKGSAAAKLYHSLTKVEEQGDNAMGGRSGTDKQGAAIDCSVENDHFVRNAYSCTIKVSTAGESVSPAM